MATPSEHYEFAEKILNNLPAREVPNLRKEAIAEAHVHALLSTATHTPRLQPLVVDVDLPT